MGTWEEIAILERFFTSLKWTCSGGNLIMSEERYTFQADVHRVLDIVINSLYQHRDIFLRELISNAADALHKLQFQKINNVDIHDPEAELKIIVEVDEEQKIITVKDTGIGMTKDELRENLGTIAQSGTLRFLEEIKKHGTEASIPELIGQFGVGFYSIFMVAKEVTVRSRSYKKDEPAHEWVSQGTESFIIRPTEKDDRGTEVIIKLKDDAEEFADKSTIRQIIKKYSDYVPFPIELDGEVTNQQTSLWRKSPSEVEEEEYEKFYQYVSNSFDKPLHVIHYSVDAPLQLNCLLYIPSFRKNILLIPESEWGVRLYSRNVLIQERSKEVLPSYFRFIEGVVDSEDLPLNVSRETVQVSRVVASIKKTLTNKLLKELDKIARSDQEKYAKFWKEFGIFIKDGVINDEKNREKLIKLLRFKTNKTKDDEIISLDEYLKRKPEDQDAIYYLIADDLTMARNSPHLEYYEEKGWEVLFLIEPVVDSFLLMHVRSYKDVPLKAIDVTDEPITEESEDEDSEKDQEKSGDDGVDEDIRPSFKKLRERVKEVLGDKILEVRASTKLRGSPCRLTAREGFGAQFQRIYRYMTENIVAPPKVLELNPHHPIIEKLEFLVEAEPENELINKIIWQLFENSLLLDGNLQQPTSMIPRINEIILAALDGVVKSN